MLPRLDCLISEAARFDLCGLSKAAAEVDFEGAQFDLRGLSKAAAEVDFEGCDPELTDRALKNVRI